MNPRQEQRSIIVDEIKNHVKIDVEPYPHGIIMAALDTWACEPVWERQIKFWKFVTFMLFVALLTIWGWS